MIILSVTCGGIVALQSSLTFFQLLAYGVLGYVDSMLWNAATDQETSRKTRRSKFENVQFLRRTRIDEIGENGSEMLRLFHSSAILESIQRKTVLGMHEM
jgi:hypothetical protein